ncbi:MAG: Universal stress protein UspA and related nucleotide-binding protein [Rhodospirillaceae bacterium]|nr:MAG: Universal stress protein UspA and related nucleotide-binding protein [Rhodospirillaceae bacterium]
MAYRDILVHVDARTNNLIRLKVAARLARLQEARLIGLFIRPWQSLPEHLMLELDSQAVEIQEGFAQSVHTVAETIFRTAAEREGAVSEWRAVDGSLAAMLTLHARYVDLVVLGQRDPDHVSTQGERGLIHHLLLETGRPVLVAPYVGRFATVGERVLVAWNASRGATRVVHDAIPILVAARHVQVVTVNPVNGSHGDIPCADICHHLARHGVRAEAFALQAEDMAVGAMLLSHAVAEGFDLMVMGAYGHSRLRGLVTGGVTRHILRHMTLPVLMGR